MTAELSYKLIIIDDEGKTTPVPLTREDYTLGRQEGNVIRLTERNISRKHARFFLAKGHWIVEDLSSYNGVRINNEKVKQRGVVKSGDSIQIGDYRLIFREIAEADTEDSVIVAGGEESFVPPPPRLTTAAPGEQPKLIIINGPEPGTVVSIKDGRSTIGRGENCNVRVEDVSVSREHANLELTENYCKIEDPGSSNGIRINGVSRSEHFLQHGDTVELGNILVRFVAAGAWDPLLEQLQSQSTLATVSSRRALTIGLPLAILGLLLVVGVAVLLISHNRKTLQQNSADISPDDLKTLSIDELIHRAQTSYDAQEWRNAITYAAEVLKYEPSNQRVKDIKNKATYEMEQQASFDEGFKEYKRKNWEQAYYTFSKIGEKSIYRPRPEVSDAASRYIDQLLGEMTTALASKDESKVEEKALIIESMPEATDEQKQQAKLLLRDAKKDGPAKKPSSTGGTPTAAKKIGEPEVVEAVKKPVATEEDSSAATEMALTEAKKAILANDQKKCIAVLQKAKTTPNVLDLLATCYKGAKEMDRYYATLKRYISKYPTGPKAEKYTTILKEAGQL